MSIPHLKFSMLFQFFGWKLKHHFVKILKITCAVAGPGFSRGAPTSPKNRLCQPIIWQYFCRKLHENERNWAARGRSSLTPPLDLPLMWSGDAVPRVAPETYHAMLVSHRGILVFGCNYTGNGWKGFLSPCQLSGFGSSGLHFQFCIE